MKQMNDIGTDEWDESVSVFMDGESQDSVHVINRLKNDHILQLKWQRYHVIKDILHDALASHISASFPDRVMQALNQEPTVLAPVRRAHQWAHIAKPFVGIGVAAAVASFTFYGLQNFHGQSGIRTSDSVEVSVDQSNNRVDLPRVVDYQNVRQQQHPSGRMYWEGSQEEVQELLNDYLMNHTEYSAAGNMHGMVPYVRVVGFDGNHQ